MKNILGIIAILVWTVSAGGLIYFSGILDFHQHIRWSILIGLILLGVHLINLVLYFSLSRGLLAETNNFSIKSFVAP